MTNLTQAIEQTLIHASYNKDFGIDFVCVDKTEEERSFKLDIDQTITFNSKEIILDQHEYNELVTLLERRIRDIQDNTRNGIVRMLVGDCE